MTPPASDLTLQQAAPETIKAHEAAAKPADNAGERAKLTKLARFMIFQRVKAMAGALDESVLHAWSQQRKQITETLKSNGDYLMPMARAALPNKQAADFGHALNIIERTFERVFDIEERLRPDAQNNKPQAMTEAQFERWSVLCSVDLDFLNSLPKDEDAILGLNTEDGACKQLRELLCARWARGVDLAWQAHNENVLVQSASFGEQVTRDAVVLQKNPAPQVARQKLDALASTSRNLEQAMQSLMTFAGSCESKLKPLASDPLLSADTRETIGARLTDIGTVQYMSRYGIVGLAVTKLYLILHAAPAVSSEAWVPVADSIKKRFDALSGQIPNWLAQARLDDAPEPVRLNVLRVLAARCNDMALDCRYLRAQLPAPAEASWLQNEAVTTLGELADQFDRLKSHLYAMTDLASASSTSETMDPQKARAAADAYIEKFFKQAPAHQAPPSPEQPVEEEDWMKSEPRPSPEAAAQSSKAGASGRRAAQVARQQAREAQQKKRGEALKQIEKLYDDTFDTKLAITSANNVFRHIALKIDRTPPDQLDPDALRAEALKTVDGMRLKFRSARLDTLNIWIEELQKHGGSMGSTVGRRTVAAIRSEWLKDVETLRKEDTHLRARAEELWEDAAARVLGETFDTEAAIAAAETGVEQVAAELARTTADQISPESVHSLALDAIGHLQLDYRSTRLDWLQTWIGDLEKHGQTSTVKVGQRSVQDIRDEWVKQVEALREQEALLQARADGLWESAAASAFMQYATTAAFWEPYRAGLFTIQRERPGREKLSEWFHVRMKSGESTRIAAYVTGEEGKPEFREADVDHAQIHWHFANEDDPLPVTGSIKNALQEGEVGDVADRCVIPAKDVADLYRICVEESRGLPTIRRARTL